MLWISIHRVRNHENACSRGALHLDRPAEAVQVREVRHHLLEVVHADALLVQDLGTHGERGSPEH